MRNFIKTIVPTEGYQEVKKIGERYVVHLEGVEDGDITTCYECMTDSEPNLDELTQELQEWKAYSAERDLATAKKIKIAELVKYDSSTAVENFEIHKGGKKFIDYWLKDTLRQSLKSAVQASIKEGPTYNFDVREYGITLTLSNTKFLSALETLEIYAYTAYNVTSRHMAAINALTTKEEVEEYDFTTGFPQQLVFNAEDMLAHE